MLVRGKREQWLSLLAAALVSAVLFYSGFFTFLFAVPVQVVFSRRGAERGLLAAGITVLLVLAVHTVQALRFSGPAGYVLLDVLTPVGMLAGLAFFNLARRYPWWLRLIAGGGIALVAALPGLRALLMAGAGEGELGEQFRSMFAMMGVNQDWELWVDLITRVVLSSVGLALTAGIAANWWLGNGIVLRGAGAVQTLRYARVPDRLIWMVITGLAIIVASWVSGVGTYAPAGWNLALVGGFLYSIQGIGLIQHLLHLRGVSPQGERWVLTVALIAFFIPGMNVLVAGGLPLLGMSELWIDYRRGDRYEGHTEQ